MKFELNLPRAVVLKRFSNVDEPMTGLNRWYIISLSSGPVLRHLTESSITNTEINI